MTHTDFAEAVRKEAGRYVTVRSAGSGWAEVRRDSKVVFMARSLKECQSEADRLNNAAVLAMVGPLVEALRQYATGYTDTGARARAALATLETTDAPLTLTENTLHLLATTPHQGASHEG
jgi:hypothetical protein